MATIGIVPCLTGDATSIITGHTIIQITVGADIIQDICTYSAFAGSTFCVIKLGLDASNQTTVEIVIGQVVSVLAGCADGGVIAITHHTIGDVA